MSLRGKHLKKLAFIPGRFVLAQGTRADYKSLARFHYVAGPPATWTQIWSIYHCIGRGVPPFSGGRGSLVPVAIAVVSYPCLNCDARERALDLRKWPAERRHCFVNQNIRTISRLIVHPTYRGLGLASVLLKCILKNCLTRYIEALATMARAHPLFARSGMREFSAAESNKPHYYLFDKEAVRG